MTEIVEQAGGREKTSTKVGVVTSKGSSQTIRVEINVLVKHPLYGKYLRSRTRLAVHDPANVAKMGDVVEIAPCRRLSRTKSWRLVKVVRSGGQAEMEPVAAQAPAEASDKG
jgi:small subunit ribosomal protein S17